MKTVLGIIFIISLFGSIAMLRGSGLGMDINPDYFYVSLLIAVVTGIWLFVLKKKHGS